MHDFDGGWFELPAAVQVRYPRTIDDEIIETALALREENNLIGLALHEPRGSLPVYGSREPAIIMPVCKRTVEDDVAELNASLITDEEWLGFIAAER